MRVIVAACLFFVSTLSHALVGSIPGQFSVSPTGAATYSIPIEVPPGIGGMQPELSLEYNSQSGNGLLGVGWSLGGLSAITRCPKTLAQDGEIHGVGFTSEDRFCLDGQRLIAVSGAYGSNGTQYRTEIDGYSKIVSYGQQGNGPEYFEIHTKAGLVAYYGVTENSRIEAEGRSDVLIWANNQTVDSFGNYVEIIYMEAANSLQYYPSTIKYTGNTQTGRATFAEVDFTYDNRIDTAPAFINGSKLQLTKRLSLISTKLSHTASVIREYKLSYRYDDNTSFSQLENIELCADSLCINKTEFTWAGKDSSWDKNYTANLSQGYDSGRAWVDFNGDGRADFCRIIGGEVSGYYLACTVSTGEAFGETYTKSRGVPLVS